MNTKFTKQKTTLLQFCMVVLFFVLSNTAALSKTQAPPVITIKGDNPHYHQVNTAYNDEGATALADGALNITSLIITQNGVQELVPGTYEVKYTVTDAYGQTATATRIVIVGDRIAPVLTSAPGKDFMYACLNDMQFSEPQVTGTDDYWPSVQITRTGNFNISVKGTYVITYTGTDGAGNTAVLTRTIKVVDCIDPVIVFTAPVIVVTDTVVNLFQGVGVIDVNFPESDFFNGRNNCKVEILSSNVNPFVPGTYQVCYLAINGIGLTGTNCRQVKVENATTGVTEIAAANQLKIYPNPGNGVFDVEVDASNPANITVTNMTGQILKTIESPDITNGKIKMDMDDAPAGIYFITLTSAQKIITQRFVVLK